MCEKYVMSPEAREAAAVAAETWPEDARCGCNIPDEVMVSAAMHLNRENVEDLIAAMQRWLDTGSLSE